MNNLAAAVSIKAFDNFTKPIKKMQAAFLKFSSKMQASIDATARKLDKLASGIKKTAAVTAALIAVFIAGTADIAKTGAEFDQSLVTAAAKFPEQIQKGTEAFSELEKAAATIGETTEFQASRGAEGLRFLAQAGFDAQAAIGVLPKSVDLATASNLDLATATDYASDALGIFNLETKDTNQLVKNFGIATDVMAIGVNRANMDMTQLFESMKEGGSVATAAGQDIQTFVALSAGLAGAGIKGSKAGTSLKNVFLGLVAPTSEAGVLMDRLGIKTVDAMGNVRDSIDIFADLQKEMKKLDEGDRLKVAEKLFGRIGLAGANRLLTINTENLRGLRQELYNSEGATKKLADIMRNTLSGDLKQLDSVIESVKLSTFSLIEDALREVVGGMVEWIRENKTFISQNLGAVLKFILENAKPIVKILATLATFAGSILALNLAFKILSGTMIVVNAVMAANPVGLIALAIAGLIGLIATMVIWWDEIVSVLRYVWDEFGNVIRVMLMLTGPIGWFINAAIAIIENWDTIGPYFENLVSGIWDGFKWLGGGIGSFIFDAVQFAKSAIQDLISWVMDSFAYITEKFSGFLEWLGIEANNDVNLVKENRSQIILPEQAALAQKPVTNELRITDETDRAVLENTQKAASVGIVLANSGGM